MSSGDGIDVDRPQTWPQDVAEVVDEHAEQLRTTTQFADDLDLSYDDEAAFLRLLGGRPLRMYHCTRLLEVEVQTVRREGLRLLTRELMKDKIGLAVAAGAFTAAEGDELARAHVFATGEHRGREQRVCLVLSGRPLDTNPGGIKPLMRTWGGEALSMSSTGSRWRARLEQVGHPTVVVVDAAIAPAAGHSVYPGVLKTFVGAALGLDVGGDVHYRAPVPTIVDLWRPGDRPYDALRALPRN